MTPEEISRSLKVFRTHDSLDQGAILELFQEIERLTDELAELQQELAELQQECRQMLGYMVQSSHSKCYKEITKLRAQLESLHELEKRK